MARLDEQKPDRSRQLVAVVVGAVGAAALIVLAGRLGDLTFGWGAFRDARRRRSDVSRRGPGRSRRPVRSPGGPMAAVRGCTSPAQLAVILGAVLLAGLVAGVVAADPGRRLNEFEKPPSAACRHRRGRSRAELQRALAVLGRGRRCLRSRIPSLESAREASRTGGRATPRSRFSRRNPHSLPLQQAAELGVPGALLFFGFLVARRDRSGSPVRGARRGT